MRERKEFEEYKNKIGVYTITSPSGRVYVGMTCDSFNGRWRNHYKLLSNSNRLHHCIALQNAFNEYGWENLQIKVIEYWNKPTDVDEHEKIGLHILKREKEVWNDFKNNGVKLMNAEPSGMGGVTMSDAQKVKIGLASQKRYNKIFNNNYYKVISLQKLPPRIIAEKLNISIKMTLKILKENSIVPARGVKLRKRKKPLKKKEILIKDKIIYSKCNNSDCNKNIYVKNKKFCSRMCANSNRYKKDFTPEDIKKLYWEDKLSANQIGEKYGFSGQFIRNYMRKNDIPLLEERKRRK